MTTSASGPLLGLLALTPLGADSFASQRLWRPAAGRSVYGGQLVAHSLLSAAATVDVDRFAIHSAHVTFVAAAAPTEVVVYTVDRVRDGRSYALRWVTARQGRTVVLLCMASFHVVSEVTSLEHAYRMPAGVPPPSALPDATTRLRRMLADERLPEQFRPRLLAQLNDASALDVRYCRLHDPFQLTPVPPHHCFWVRSSPIPDAVTDLSLAAPEADGAGSAPHRPRAVDDGSASGTTARRPPPTSGFLRVLHAAGAAYASDFSLLGTAVLPHGSPNPFVSLMASLDHTMWFHGPMRCDDWMLLECESPRMVSGRGLAFGRFFTWDGQLVMSVAQEGVIRVHSFVPPQPPVFVDRGSMFNGMGARSGWQLVDDATPVAGDGSGMGGVAALVGEDDGGLSPTSESLMAVGLGDTGGAAEATAPTPGERGPGANVDGVAPPVRARL